MKYIQNTKLVIVSFLLLFAAFNARGQCDLELQQKVLNKIYEDKAIYLKNFSVDLGSGENVSAYSLVLKKRTWYRFYFAESDKFDGKGHFEINDNNHFHGITKNPLTGKTVSYFDLKCNETKIYNFSINKDSGEDYCAEVVLAFVRKIKDPEKIKIEQNNLNPDAKVFFIADIMPEFIEGNTTAAFQKWIRDNVVYPEEAKSDRIQGKVYVSFIVNRTGEIEDVQIVKGVDPILDNYVLELIKKSPRWARPGYKDGVPVNLKFTFPVVFKL